jgi:hypothetical protein
MSYLTANLPHKNTLQSPVFSTTAKDMNSILGQKTQQKSSEFIKFLDDEAAGFKKETVQLEEKVTQFAEGKLDIEAVASEVATMSIKVDAAKRTAEELKTGIHSLLNMQM